jgi:predicted ATPase
VRLLTLTGPGGIGKTCLALRIAADMDAAFADGAAFVDLAAITEPDLVPAAIAGALALGESGGQTADQRLRASLRDKHQLLVLDNFEQVLAAAPLVSDLLAACPHLKILVTSRAPLRVRGECEAAVPPLALPAGPGYLNPAALSQYTAVTLFVQRAQAARPEFALTATNAEAVAAICTRLDGLPLAIELAAARIKYVTPATLLGRLEHRLQMLTGGPRDLPARQQTLRGAIAWSYDLLDPAEQRLFAQLSVFLGGWTLEAAEQVCADPGMPARAEPVVHGLASLVDKNLIRCANVTPDDEPRFTMLETMREFAVERLDAGSDAAASRERHARYYLGLAERAEQELAGADQGVWLTRLAHEHDNLRALLEWAHAGGAVELGLRAAGSLWRFWIAQGYLSEGLRRTERLLALPCSVTAVRARALYGASVLATELSDQTRMVVHARASLELYRALGDRKGLAGALNILAYAAGMAADYERALAYHEESLVVAREADDANGMARSLNNLGILARYRGDFARAATHYQESLGLYTGLGNYLGVATTLTNIAELSRYRGDSADAERRYQEAIALHHRMGHRVGVAECLAGQATVAAIGGCLKRAARLWGAAEALRETSGATPAPADREDYARHVAAARAAVPAEQFQGWWADGRALSVDDAVALACTREP